MFDMLVAGLDSGADRERGFEGLRAQRRREQDHARGQPRGRGSPERDASRESKTAHRDSEYFTIFGYGRHGTSFDVDLETPFAIRLDHFKEH